MSSAVPAESLEERLYSLPLIHHGQYGTLATCPGSDFDRLLDATPGTTGVTVLFPEREYTATLPVLCERTAIQNE
ncbi:hypothetical protein [Halomicrobium urmianum]|uniref:hypothetical protein n=1 Tax=Halomicrobium urmianum TaxID=1586233 RepID=UPI001CD9D22D|nr:hypothetical protein [Halomicrobium urmianum]